VAWTHADRTAPRVVDSSAGAGRWQRAPVWLRNDAAAAHYRERRIRRWEALARIMDRWQTWGGAYHRRLEQVYRFHVPPGMRVLEIGCAKGDLLAAVEPAVGVGLDFSQEMLKRAATRYPHLRFIEADAHDIPLDETFDVIILSDLVNDLWDVQTVLREVARLSHPRTRLILNFYSRLWELPLALTERLRLAAPTLRQNWLTPHDVRNLLHLTGFEALRHWQEVLLPLRIPLLASLCNRVLVKLWPLNHLALTHFMVARPCAGGQTLPACQGGPGRPAEPTVSVVIPARNEAGNIRQIFARVPDLGRQTELVFVEGGSTDDTYAAIQRAIADNPLRRCQLLRQTGKGKWDAVRTGFAAATGDVLMILDADLTVAPEDLPLFYEALRSGKGEFINGVRLVYPMDQQAMRFFNLVGNKFFSWAFTAVLGQPVKDTLCGTKVLWRRDYERITAFREYFGDIDPFGDFNLLFGAAKLDLRVVDLPVRYRERTYGATNISRWRHGWLLLRMVFAGARRLRFV
jgi:SAM-dependent methyltransferase